MLFQTRRTDLNLLLDEFAGADVLHLEGVGELLALRGFATAAAPDHEDVSRVAQHQVLDVRHRPVENVVRDVLRVDGHQFACQG